MDERIVFYGSLFGVFMLFFLIIGFVFPFLTDVLGIDDSVNKQQVEEHDEVCSAFPEAKIDEGKYGRRSMSCESWNELTYEEKMFWVGELR